VGVLSGGGSAQVDPPGGSPVPPPPGKGPFAAFIRPAWMPSAPFRALKSTLPGANLTYTSGDDLAAGIDRYRFEVKIC